MVIINNAWIDIYKKVVALNFMLYLISEY